jgi:hypothetical protein
VSIWLDGEGRTFNPHPTVSVLPLFDGQVCVVIDDVLAHPEGLREWACGQVFGPPDYPYPGLVCDAAPEIQSRTSELFAQHARRHLGARRTLDSNTRLSLVTTAPAALAPIQWLCHRDRYAHGRREILFAASVLYLFSDPALGGTSFYRPRRPAADIDAIVADSAVLGAADFSARYGLQPGYMAGSNDWFERVARVPAAWNRVIFYDGGLFHSADLGDPARLVADPRRGRLTLNSFITAHRGAG